ncbi:phage tail tube protein [uncultured Flavobacterium sp.]|uniref:phage tail tube protein n=1 Tax=uncultured Flavobacterium sp. TaxID=165435 RepID=UPI0025CDDAAF|nr:phage tail tube protein [uncultured Flavobacterium sp.]
MASTIYNGKFLRFSFSGKKLIHATNCKLTVASKLEEIATKDTDGTVSIPSGYSFTGSAEALLSNLPNGDTTHVTADQLLDNQLAGTEVDIQFTTNVTGDFIYKGKAFINNTDIGAEVDQSVKVTISFTGNGNIEKETVV